ncbi:dihydroneopterin aldolase [bacterium]|nr:dihydroneopterin aldolase [bacterium]
MYQNPFDSKVMGSIALEGMEFFAFHGVSETEQKIGRTFVVDVHFEMDFEKAAIDENLEETADYARLYQIVKSEMKITQKLLESVARRMAWRIKNEFPTCHNLQVAISKMAPIVGGKCTLAKVSYKII